MKLKQLTEKLTEKEKERYHLAYLNQDGAMVYISNFIKDEDTGTIVFFEENKKISVENTINFMNKISKQKVCVNRSFINEIKAVIRVILNEMEEKKISYDEIYDRLHGIEKALQLNEKN